MAINPNYAVTIVQSDTNTHVTAPMPETFSFDTEAQYEAPFAQGILGGGMIGSAARIAGIKLTSQILTAQIWQGTTDTILTLTLEFHAETDVLKDVRDPILQLLKLSAATANKGGMLESPGPSLNAEGVKDILAEAGDNISKAFNIGKDIASQGGDYVNNLAKQAEVKAQQSAAQLKADAAKKIPGAGALLGQNSVANGNNRPAPKRNTEFRNKWNKRLTNQISIQIGNYAYFESVVITSVRKTYSAQIDAATGQPQHATVEISFKPLFLVLQEDLEDIFEVRDQASFRAMFNSRSNNYNG